MRRNLSDEAFASVMNAICARFDSPQATELARSVLSCDRPPAKWFPDPETLNAVEFADQYFLSKILSKWKGWRDGGSIRRAAALTGWEADEAQNARTNERIRDLRNNTGYPGSDLITIISIAQYHISRALGRFSLKRAMSECRWGPGATWDYPMGTYRGTKISNRMSTTVECIPYMKLIIESDPNWIEAITGFYPEGPVSLVKDFWTVTDSSRVTTVPKDWDKDRIIDIQPTACGFLQQGMGRYLRRILLSLGIDLDSQEQNQLHAFYAYYAELATLDLKSASDSVTTELVSLLIPPDWCQYLFSLRTKYSQIGGRRGPKVRIEKFSAMGNAFTFELETLIFWALSKAVSEFEGVKDGTVLVYGDDIIVDRKIADTLITALNYCGFGVNETKSFTHGHFFESCGEHFHSGVCVTPIYQKSVVNSPEECIRFHNRLVRWGDRIHGDPWYFYEALTLLQALYYDSCRNEFLSSRELPVISIFTEGDDGFIVEESRIKRDRNGGYFTSVLRQRVPRDTKLNHACYLQLKLADRSYSNGSPKGHPEEPAGRGRYRLSRVYIYR